MLAIRFLMALCAVSITGVLAAEAALLEAGTRVDPSRVYYGSAESFRSPADLLLSQVFAEIPAWRRIREEGIPSDDPRYWLLVKRANEVFQEGVRRAAGREGHDLVAERGAVRTGEAVPDLTRRVIEEVRGRE